MKRRDLLFLLTNDDGIHAPGLAVLKRHLDRLGETLVVAPETERSAVGHAINLAHPVRVHPVRKGRTLFGYSCTGTPADCVKIGVKRVSRRTPDFVVAGINPGANAGMYVRYSGTVSAAAEGVLLGIPGIAVSVEGRDGSGFELAGRTAVRVVEAVLERGLPPDVLLNVNVPSRAPVRGIRAASQSACRYAEAYEERRDPRGGSYYWLAGSPNAAGPEEGSDVAALAGGWIAVTPIRLDMTDRRFLPRLRTWRFGGLGRSS